MPGHSATKSASAGATKAVPKPSVTPNRTFPISDRSPSPDSPTASASASMASTRAASASPSGVSTCPLRVRSNRV